MCSSTALALVPLGGAGLFLGLSATTVKLLRYEGFLLAWAQPARAALLIGAIAWSLYLASERHQSPRRQRPAPVAGVACVSAGCALVGYGWWLQFWGW